MASERMTPSAAAEPTETALSNNSIRESSSASCGPWVVYIVCCADHTLYTGISNDLAARIKRHNKGQGAKYTRSRRPVRLVYHEAADSRSNAQRREYAIRKLSARKKRGLIASGQGPDC